MRASTAEPCSSMSRAASAPGYAVSCKSANGAGGRHNASAARSDGTASVAETPLASRTIRSNCVASIAAGSIASR